MKWLKIACVSLLAAAAIFAALVWLYPNPFGPIPGRRLTGEEQPYPARWDFTDEQRLVFVETRPEAPHSVSTICFVHEGELYVPARGGAEKRWTAHVLADPRIRLKVGNAVFPARARRVEGVLAGYLPSVVSKYRKWFPEEPRVFPPDLWLFRIEPREG